MSFGLWRRLKRWRPFFSASHLTVGSSYQAEDYILGWGYKKSGLRAINLAKKKGLQGAILIEDGFLRSMGLGVSGDAPLSIVVDDLGVYYDASKPSCLEQLILSGEMPESLLADSARALRLVIEHQLTKYNHLPATWPAHLPFDAGKKQVLVIDQTFGDLSLQYGGVTPETFQEMLSAAKAENPDAVIWVKIHPDVLAGKKQGHFTAMMPELQADIQVRLLAEDLHPHALLARMDRVYVATSQMGFEALMLGKEVITFGLPWYAGWGLTEDRHPQVQMPAFKSRRRHATLLELFTASYLQYCRYLNPYTGKRGTIFDVIDYLIMMKRREALLAGEIWVVGLSFWKRQIIRPFIQSYRNQLRYFRTEKALREAYAALPESARSNIRLLIWGKQFPDLVSWAEQEEIAILRMEDGFIRSVGLGSNLVPPRSLVLDDRGIYFDASQPSRLEALLTHTTFSAELLAEAEALQRDLIAFKVGKYNVGDRTAQIPRVKNRPILLVPGQVEDDASIQTGTRDINTNLGLLQAVRRQNPESYIVYKPHPDVVSGNRLGHVDEALARQYADLVMAEGDIIAMIEQCDELHTMTSLSGFEALLRGKKVVCYGIPFYANWGLTEDHYTLTGRRGRKLTLSELIAGTLILYPTYLNINTGKITNATTTLQALVKEREAQGQTKLKTTYLERKWQQLKGLWRVMGG
ncbi:hypothetical protein B9T19_02790 [Ignatzschineria sp. F8392]|nr:hypothetical protein B9T19_02790 [Ignatzschineria sp. F8392]